MNPPRSAPSPFEIRWIGILAVLALALRITALLTATSGSTLTFNQDDDGDHINFARHLALEGEYKTLSPDHQTYRAWRPPLFILFLTGVFKLHGIDSFLAARFYLVFFSLLIPFSVWRLTRLAGGPTAGIISFAWASVHPFFVYYAVHVQADSFFVIVSTVAITLLMMQSTLPQAFLSGILIGASCLGRSVFAGAALVGVAWPFFSKRIHQKGVASVLFGAGVLLVLSPWWIRNYQLFHQFIPFSSEGGYTLWVGNNPLADGGGDCPPSPVPPELGELERDRWHYEAAVTYIKENPRRTAELAISKLSRFWGVVPRVGGWGVKLVSFFAIVPMFLFAGVGFWIIQGRRWLYAPFLALCLYFSAIHTIFPALMRYRLSLEPFFISLAAMGFCHFLWKLLPSFRSRAIDPAQDKGLAD